MDALKNLQNALSKFVQVNLGHLPTPLEAMPNLGAALGLDLWVKRDDCTGVGMGGNKVRQLAFYFGAAKAQGADCVLITGAVQSNFVCTTAAFAAKCKMECHIQLEERVPDVSDLYRNNGNVLLNRLFGANLHSYPTGEDEAGADAALGRLAEKLQNAGKTPYIVKLGIASAPLGALGYVAAAAEIVAQAKDMPPFDEIIVPSGSALTHAGLLFGLRALGDKTPVCGICVRRAGDLQSARIAQKLDEIGAMLRIDTGIKSSDINVFDGVLAPGYGQINPAVTKAIKLMANREGVLLDPVYTGKSMAGLMALAKAGNLRGGRVLFWHTGGSPALFAYGDQLL